MLFGTRSPVVLEPVYVFLELGQSNGHGPRFDDRFFNTYNYKGVSTGYPAARVAQDQYEREPANFLTYYKNTVQSADQSTDNGAWEPYNAGVNSSRQTTSTIQYYGTELSCGVTLQEHTGKTVCVIKAAFGTTALSSTATGSLAPGNWNTASRTVAIEYYLKRGIRDLQLLYPNRRIRVVGVNWWQGENDATNNISTATYKSQFYLLKAAIDTAIAGVVVQEFGQKHIWSVVKLEFYRSGAEGNINTALAQLDSENTDVYLVDSTPYPQLDEMSAAERSPIAIGAPNAVGGYDDNHTCQIGMFAVGEFQADNMIAHHGL